jgi:hypothetical protein
VTSLQAAEPAPQIPRTWTEIPSALARRLAAEGVHSLADWRALGRKRLQLFGVTRAMAADLDRLARGGP